MILNCPISAVCATCGPPHNSRENTSPVAGSNTEYAFTRGGYFSWKNPKAPFCRASSYGISSHSTFRSRRIASFTHSSVFLISSGVSFRPNRKSKRVRSTVMSEPSCRTSGPSTARSAACRRCVAVCRRVTRSTSDSSRIVTSPVLR